MAAIATGAFIALILIVAVVGAALAGLFVGTGKSPATNQPPSATAIPLRPWSVKISGGSMPNQQVVGQHVTLRLTVNDTGRYIPDLTLWFQGLGSWVIDSVFGDCGDMLSSQSIDVLGDGNVYDFGSLGHGMTRHPVLQLTAKAPGNHTLSYDTYSTLTSGLPGNQLTNDSYSSR